MTRDYYADLDLAPSANETMIRVAYRAKAKELHPDRGADAGDMAKVNAAYEVLADPVRRADYDRQRQAAQASPATTEAVPQESWGQESGFEPAPAEPDDDWGSEAQWTEVVDEPPPPPRPAPPEPSPVYPWEAGAPPRPAPSAPRADPLTSWRPAWPKLPRRDPRSQVARVATIVSLSITALVCIAPIIVGAVTQESANASGLLFWVFLGWLALFSARRRAAGLPANQGGYRAYIVFVSFCTAVVLLTSPVAAALTLVWTVPFFVMVETRNRYFRARGIR